MRRKIPLIFLALMLLFGLAPGVDWVDRAAAEVNLSHRAALSLEVDDNVYKANKDLTMDYLGRLFYDFGLNWVPSTHHLLHTDYQLGGKMYADENTEDTIINQLLLGYTNYSIPTTYLGLQGSGKLRNVRDAEEDYFKFIGEAFVGKRFFNTFNAEIRASYIQFDFRSFDYYDYWTQAYGTQLRYDYQRSFSLGSGYRFERKVYPFNALTNVGPESGNILLMEGDERRVDNLHEINVFGRYQSFLFEKVPFLINIAYVMQINDSNSYGDSYYNHRFLFGWSQDLMTDTNLHLLGIFQVRDSSEKVLIPHSYSIEEDDENYNQVQVRLTHGLTDYLRVQASYSRYWSHYDYEDLNFIKNLYAIGLAVSF